jgi:hypothetical protein
MFSITIHNGRRITRLIMESLLTGEWVKELERCRQGSFGHTVTATHPG